MIKAILLDIEGTTTPIDFVHKTLFPFAKARIADFVRANFDQIQNEIAQLKTEHAKDGSYSKDFDEQLPQSITDYLHFLIDADRKSTPLKSLQGQIWQKGYTCGELLSEVFDDVPLAFERWRSSGKVIAIYSSGSVLAQQLLFRYTNHDDLTPFISVYFDTNTGGKRESESYLRIAVELGVDSSDVLFVSDIVAELDAAHEAGMQTALSVREGNAATTGQANYNTITSFDDLYV